MKSPIMTFLFFLPLAAHLACANDPDTGMKPIVLRSSGGFAVGGSVITNPDNATQTLSCDHGYMEYFLPWSRRKTSLVMWHSSGTQIFQNRFDGGEGYKDMFLRKDYPVYLWEGPRIGRANWPCVSTNYTPAYLDPSNFWAWNFGPTFKQWWPDTQFPRDNDEAWNQATRARVPEYDTEDNVILHAQSAAIAADSGKVGSDIVYVTNSAAGFRALLATTLSNSTNIRGIVAYECIGSVFPEGTTGIPATDGTPKGYFGPQFVSEDDFRKLARLSVVQFVWGDHRGADGAGNPLTQFLNVTRYCAEIINKFGGNAEVLLLGDEAGLKGSSHLAFADMDNAKVGALLDGLLKKNGLDGYTHR